MTEVRLACGCETSRTDPQHFETLYCPEHDRDVRFQVVA